MKFAYKEMLFLIIAATISLARAGNVHDIQKRATKAEEEQARVQTYQLRLQNTIAAKYNKSELTKMRSDPLQCYSCQDAKTNEECNAGGMVTCLPTQTSCQTEIRIFNPTDSVSVRIKKGCKQDRACHNNFLQNDRKAWPSTQCKTIPRTSLSVCRYCCTDPGCNKALPAHVCGPISPPENGHVSCSTSKVQSSVCTFTCDPCHNLVGSRVRMCLEDSAWSGTETKCVYDNSLPGCAVGTTCPAKSILSPDNGNVECSNSNKFGSECRFICDRGYMINGKRVLRCNENTRDWDAVRPICVRGDDTSNPCNVFAVFDFASDGKLECECSTGFRGDGYISCEDVNECQEGSHVCDSNAICINTLGSYRCKCKVGYVGNGRECRDINECTSSANDCDVENGLCINIDGGYTCTCKPEYTGDGVNCSRVNLSCPGGLVDDLCLPDEPAHGEDPTKPVELMEEEPPTDKQLFSDGFSSLAKVDSCVRLTEHRPSMVRDPNTYENMNKKLLNKLMSYSNSSRIVFGPWIGLDDRIESGVLRWRDGKPLDRKDFQVWAPGQPKLLEDGGLGNCVNLISDPVSSHTTSFLWQVTLCSSATRYVCDTERSDEPIVSLCIPLVDPTHGKVSCSNGWRINSVCSYSCDPGYILRGPSSRITCQSKNMMWDNEPPVCVRAICDRPLMPPNSGRMECTDENREFSVCRFTCKPGYTLHGNSTVTCQRNLKWSSQRPCCRDDCPPYARMNLIMVLDSSRSINAENFELIKTFAKRLHRRFEVSEDFTHVSVISYSSRVELLNNKTVFKSSDELDSALDNLAYEGAGTLIGRAITYVTDNLAGKRPGSGDIVVVLTDGISHDDVYFPSKTLQETGAHIIAVGVRHAWRYQLQMIASEPTDVNVVEVETYNDLNHIVNVIGQKVCHLSC
ncbi:uncharacterized protein LOC120326188 [Styela clava]